jgi:long-chain acyl-CoA synthetase
MINFQEAMAKLLTPAAAAPDWASRPAIIQAGLKEQGSTDKVTTFAELQTLTARALWQYKEAGVESGDSVLLCAPNSPELVAGILAAWSCGATAIPVDFRLTQPEVENIASKVNAKIVYCPRFKLANLTNLDQSIFSQGPAAPDASLLEKLKPESLGLVILTSGTTGMPKGAVHDLGSLLANFVEIGEVFGLKPATSALLPLPVSHIFGIEVMLAFLNLGGSVIFSDFSPADFWPTVSRLKPSLVVGVPTIYGALLSLPHPGPICEIVDFYLSGGAALPPSLSEQFEKTFGRHIFQGYGATETKITTINKGGPVSSIGQAIPSVTVEIVDEHDKVLPAGETGEIRISGHCLMKGYLNQPDVTESVLHDGHYHTGDIGHIEDGWVFISGRSKEMINVAGNKVFPSEVESVLRQHPLAQEVAVIGVPHRKLGQIVKAIVVVPNGQWSDRLAGDNTESKSAEEELRASLREFCAQNLKRELRPMDWEFRPASNPLPKTHTGKVDKKQLQTVHA